MIKFNIKTHSDGNLKHFTFSQFECGNYIDCDKQNHIIKDFYNSNLKPYLASLTNLGIVHR